MHHRGNSGNAGLRGLDNATIANCVAATVVAVVAAADALQERDMSRPLATRDHPRLRWTRSRGRIYDGEAGGAAATTQAGSDEQG